jgi:hypothetical protein
MANNRVVDCTHKKIHDPLSWSSSFVEFNKFLVYKMSRMSWVIRQESFNLSEILNLLF